MPEPAISYPSPGNVVIGIPTAEVIVTVSPSAPSAPQPQPDPED